MATTALVRVNELDRYLAEVSRYPILTQEEETRLAKKWRDFGDVEAAHALVTANLRFVVKIANEYRGYGARILDLVQEGSVGLMQAVKRFDPSRGYRLISYAVFWIRSHIHSFLMGTMRMIKVGTSRAHRKLFFKLRSLKGKLAAEGMDNRDDVIEAVAEKIGVDRADVEEMDRHLTGRDASLDVPVGETGAPLAEIMPAQGPTQEEMLADLEMEADRAARLETAMGTLDSREKEIVEKRYLVDPPIQLKDIGAQMGVSKQRVSQIERRAMKKLKNALSDAA
ncbi:MAG: sigma-70 family RNA polymerase sigma factor [Deltaproteobacteria bacterium]|nr:sigma-70 family RNA polymerase sigma factor [Deltaproteobacteria bacterium]